MDNPQSRGEAVALFRFGVIAPATSPHLSPAERGALVRELAGCTHVDPDGVGRMVSRTTLDRWIRAYRARGLEGLMPTSRADTGALRRHPELFEEAAAMRRELPSRSADFIAEQLTARHGIAVSARTSGPSLPPGGSPGEPSWQSPLSSAATRRSG
jgi:putative transposase